MPQGLRFNVDVVFCVDVSGSMVEHLEHVKKKILQFRCDFIEALAQRDRVVNQLRIRTIAFRDLSDDSNSLIASDFLVVEPSIDLAKFESFVIGLPASGGGDEPESGLEALSLAIGSDWTHEGDKQRHAIVMITDASAHKLESRVGEIPPELRHYVPKSLDSLNDYWNGSHSVRLNQAARRLLIVGPDEYPWNVIGDSWEMTCWLPSSVGRVLEDVELSQILTQLMLNVV